MFTFTSTGATSAANGPALELYHSRVASLQLKIDSLVEYVKPITVFPTHFKLFLGAMQAFLKDGTLELTEDELVEFLSADLPEDYVREHGFAILQYFATPAARADAEQFAAQYNVIDSAFTMAADLAENLNTQSDVTKLSDFIDVCLEGVQEIMEKLETSLPVHPSLMLAAHTALRS